MVKRFLPVLASGVLIGLLPAPGGAQEGYEVLAEGRLNPLARMGMGVDDSEQLRNWLSQAEGSLSLAYPGRLGWGAVTVTVGGAPVPAPHPHQDFSSYSTLAVEMRGERGGECVMVGIKDFDDPDDGSEPKVEQRVSGDWQTYRFELMASFSEPRHPARSPLDLSRLYVTTEFVFPCVTNDAATIYVRGIRFER